MIFEFEDQLKREKVVNKGFSVVNELETLKMHSKFIKYTQLNLGEAYH